MVNFGSGFSNWNWLPFISSQFWKLRIFMIRNLLEPSCSYSADSAFSFFFYVVIRWRGFFMLVIFRQNDIRIKWTAWCTEPPTISGVRGRVGPQWSMRTYLAVFAVWIHDHLVPWPNFTSYLKASFRSDIWILAIIAYFSHGLLHFA